MKKETKIRIALRRGAHDYRIESITGAITLFAHDSKHPTQMVELKVGEFVREDVAKEIAAAPNYEVTVRAK